MIFKNTEDGVHRCFNFNNFETRNLFFELSSDQNHGYLMYRGDYTTQLYGDCIKPY